MVCMHVYMHCLSVQLFTVQVKAGRCCASFFAHPNCYTLSIGCTMDTLRLQSMSQMLVYSGVLSAQQLLVMQRAGRPHAAGIRVC